MEARRTAVAAARTRPSARPLPSAARRPRRPVRSPCTAASAGRPGSRRVAEGVAQPQDRQAEEADAVLGAHPTIRTRPEAEVLLQGQHVPRAPRDGPPLMDAVVAGLPEPPPVRAQAQGA